MSSIPYRRQQETAAETAAHGHAAEAADDMPPLTPAEEKELVRRAKAVDDGTMRVFSREESRQRIQDLFLRKEIDCREQDIAAGRVRFIPLEVANQEAEAFLKALSGVTQSRA